MGSEARVRPSAVALLGQLTGPTLPHGIPGGSWEVRNVSITGTRPDRIRSSDGWLIRSGISSSAQSVVSGDETALAGLDLDHYSRLVWISHVTADDSLASWLCGTDAPYPARYEGIKLVSADFPPTCVVAASADTLIPPIQSHNLAQAIRACGVEAVLFECEGMIHGQAEALASSPPWPENNGWWESAIRPSLDFAIRKMTEV